MEITYCQKRKKCKGCPLLTIDELGNCKVFVKESKERNKNNGRNYKRR